jgi:multiple sugar transport system ATP-binding protein
MAAIQLNGVSKRYGSVEVIRDLHLEIAQGEFLVFLGPSGCGKTTLLRMIAGLEQVSGGSIRIGARDVTHLVPAARDVAMVFQHYALYPHMSVYDNLAFGLRNVGLDRREIDRRIQEASRILEIAEYLKRRPGQLSGGQRQRVAIGRALVKEPAAFLLDEPLSNLDAALRSRTRVELARLHRRLRSTMVFVTHDQVEAMTLATRIAVMNGGRVEQMATPLEVYRRPATRFVAGFVGTPAMNFLPVHRVPGKGGLAAVALADGTELQSAVPEAGLPAGPLTLGVRAEAITVDGEGQTRGRAEVVERLGERTLVHVGIGEGALVVGEAPRESELQAGENVGLRFDRAALHLFDERGGAYHADGGPAR